MKKRRIIEYAAALYEATRGATEKQTDEIVKNFAELIFKNCLVKKTGLIISEFKSYAKKKEGILEIEISSAQALAPKLKEAIMSKFGTKVEATTKICPELIGGVKIKSDNLIFDASLQKQLVNLKKSFNQ